ncbi:MAG: hypothetical protein KTR15_08580 [Phycisphaeraceae bacterium]|nr:hypothetical protein [Phycisphaeraceae bacterium]
MRTTSDRIELLTEQLHDLSRNTVSQPKAQALLRVADYLLHQSSDFCLDFADELECQLKRCGLSPELAGPKLRLIGHISA